MNGPAAGAKPDELKLWEAALAGFKPRVAGAQLGIHSARVAYICEKWARAGIYEYGVCADLGWPRIVPA